MPKSVLPRRVRPSLLLALAIGGAVALGLLAPEVSRAAPEPLRRHRASLTEGLDCGACHTAESWKTMGASAGSSGFDHSRTGFPLRQRHMNVPCTECHRSDRTITRQCSGCHEDAHATQLGSACDGCHSAAGWFQTTALARHRQTRLPLTGMHALADCRDCHQRTTENTWSSVPADCFACHAEDYRRPDIHPLHVGVAGDSTQPPFPRDCAQCHRATGWLPAFVRAELLSGGLALSAPRSHDSSFPISQGSHRGADCASCHVSPASPRAVRCTGCHAHDEVKLKEQHPGIAVASSACLVCHPGGRRR
jgi:hypothetical protein